MRILVCVIVLLVFVIIGMGIRNANLRAMLRPNGAQAMRIMQERFKGKDRDER